MSPIYITTSLQTRVNCRQGESWYVHMTLWFCTIFPSLIEITHELSSKESAGATSAPLTCICCDMSTWLAAFIPEQVVTEQPSVTAPPVAKVNELSGNCSGPAKFVSLQVCLHLMSSALSMGGWSGLRAPFHQSYNATWARAQQGSLLQKWVKFDFVGFCF